MAEVERATDCFVVTVEQPGADAAHRPDAAHLLAGGNGVTLMGRLGAVPAADFIGG